MYYLKISLLVLLLTYSNTTPNTEERKSLESRIDQAIGEYIVQLNFLFSTNENSRSNAIDAILTDDRLPSLDQSNDLKDELNDLDTMTLENYVRIYEKRFVNKVVGEFKQDSKVIHTECPLYTEDGKKYILVSIDRDLNFDKKNIRIDYLLFVNATDNNNYFIEFSLTRKISYIKYPESNSCKSDSEEIDIVAEKLALFNQIKNEADTLYLKGNFIQAKEKYLQAKEFYPESQDILDSIKNCEDFVIEDQKTAINKIIDNQRYTQALIELNKVENEALKQDAWYINSIRLCENNINKQNDLNQLRKADAAFSAFQTKKAEFNYKALQSSSYIDQNYISNQLIKCKERDPNFVQNKLNKAFKAAVKSKKNYLSTFQTYSKYESSGLLSGEQYYFMCLMMINKHTAVAKPMGYSKNQAKLLSRVYFYKAKEFGVNVSFLETQIFTKNIEKK